MARGQLFFSNWLILKEKEQSALFITVVNAVDHAVVDSFTPRVIHKS